MQAILLAGRLSAAALARLRRSGAVVKGTVCGSVGLQPSDRDRPLVMLDRRRGHAEPRTLHHAGTLERRDELLGRPHHERERQRRVGAEADRLAAGGGAGEQGAVRLSVSHRRSDKRGVERLELVSFDGHRSLSLALLGRRHKRPTDQLDNARGLILPTFDTPVALGGAQAIADLAWAAVACPPD